MDDEIEKSTAPDWKVEIPDYGGAEWEEKIPDRPSLHWMALFVSCLIAGLMGAVIAGLLVNEVYGPRQARMFFIYFLVIAPLLWLGWYWMFYLAPNRPNKKMRDRQRGPYGPGRFILSDVALVLS